MPTNDILFVLVIYRCTVAESLSYQTLVAPNAYASSRLFIYDNSPYAQTTDIPHVAYIHDTANGGVGRAYNSAASFASAHGYHWLLLMDQDTSFPPHALPAYLQAAASLTSQPFSCPTPPSTAPAESCVGSDSSRPLTAPSLSCPASSLPPSPHAAMPSPCRERQLPPNLPPSLMLRCRPRVGSDSSRPITPPIALVVPRHRVATGEFLSPTPVRMMTSHLQPTAPTGIVSFRDAEPINSGMMVSVSSFLRVGGYDEAVWLDFSDRCFIERYRQVYDHFLVLPDVVCTQTFSALDTDPDRILARFRIFLDCARHYPTPSLRSRLAMLITSLRPTLSRTLRSRSLSFLRAFVKIYVCGADIRH